MPSERQSAPGDLARIEHFVNDMRAETPDELTGWFALAEPYHPRVSADDADVAHAVALRETFRALLAANNGAPVDYEAEREVNDAVTRCGVEIGVQLTPTAALEYRCAASGVDGILGSYLCTMLEAIGDNRWSRLKACANPDCRWAFYDRSRNHASTWCEMRTCGSVFKMRRHRERQRRRP
jgi:predicted RNA-binding Zn ribbon-like protein